MATVINGNSGIDKVQDNAVNPATDIASGIPCFSAYAGSTTSIPQSTVTKIGFNTKEFDTTSNYDTALSRFTPNKAGYYLVTSKIRADVANQTVLSANICKNGTVVKEGSFQQGAIANANGSFVSAIVYMNGTTDYIEMFAYAGIACSSSTGVTTTYFQAHLIVGA